MAEGQPRGHPGGQQAAGLPPTPHSKSVGKDILSLPHPGPFSRGSLIIQDQIGRGVGLELLPFVLPGWALVGLEGQEGGERTGARGNGSTEVLAVRELDRPE